MFSVQLSNSCSYSIRAHFPLVTSMSKRIDYFRIFGKTKTIVMKRMVLVFLLLFFLYVAKAYDHV